MKSPTSVVYLLFLSVLYLFVITVRSEDLYELLGVQRDANNQEIRKAFKKLAVKLHPDKNPDDKDANAKFLKIARAYEILKQPDTRRHYDIHGDTESDFKDTKPQTHSYSFYKNEFGLYDDDPLIVTLSGSDYEVNILDDSQKWFVNFYSPNCHHCVELAPIWRKLSLEFQGVIRVAAVNCMEDWSLCYQLDIEAYPTLMFYEEQTHIRDGVKYHGPRTFQGLEDFVISKLGISVRDISSKHLEIKGFKNEQWLMFLCTDDNCHETKTMLKLSVALEGLMKVGRVTDPVLIQDLKKKTSKNQNSNIIFKQILDDETITKEVLHSIQGSDCKEIVENILNILPNPETIDEQKFTVLREELSTGSATPWLLCFYLGHATDLNLQLKRLPPMLSHVKIGLVHCGRSAELCSKLHIPRYPAWGVLKVGGAFELHHGRDILHEITAFAKDSVKSTNLHALSPVEYRLIKQKGESWFLDWHAPWCPPCRKLLPELRKASQHFDSSNVQFGTIDCTLHRDLCVQEGITGYPTTVFVNFSQDQTQRFHGVPSEDGIVEFVNDMLNPVVITFDDSSFIKLMRKPETEIWLVDYFASWCGPCQKLAPEWRRLAKQMADFPEVKIAQVDCAKFPEVCTSQNVRSYPNIRLYPMGSRGLNKVVLYNGNRDVVAMKRWLLYFLPSSVQELNSKDFKKLVQNEKYTLPWLVYIYVPWCGHCTHFEPVVRKVAKELDGFVKTGKMDCQSETYLCQELDITGYPRLFLYVTPSEKYEISTRNFEEIVGKVRQLVDNFNRKHDEL